MPTVEFGEIELDYAEMITSASIRESPLFEGQASTGGARFR